MMFEMLENAEKGTVIKVVGVGGAGGPSGVRDPSVVINVNTSLASAGSNAYSISFAQLMWLPLVECAHAVSKSCAYSINA